MLRLTDEVRNRLLLSARSLHAVPSSFANYDTTLAVASRFLRFEEALLRAFVREGVPHRVDAEGDPLFEYCDLLNIGAASGSGVTIPELARRFLLRFLEGTSESWIVPRVWEVSVAPLQAGHTASSDRLSRRPIDRSAPGVTWLGSVTGPELSASRFRVKLTGCSSTLNDARAIDIYEGVLDPLARGEVHYLTVPESLRQEHAKAWDARMADCVVVSRRLAEALRREGFIARARRGYLLGLLGSDHSWTEVFEDGVWKCLDVVFELVVRRSQKDTSETQKACRGARFNCLLPCETSDAEPLVLSGGRPAPPWSLASVSATPVEREFV